MAQHESLHCPGPFTGALQGPQDGEDHNAELGAAAPERGASDGGGGRRAVPGGDGPGGASARALSGAGESGGCIREEGARPNAEGETGRSVAEDAARPEAEGETGRGSAENAARPGAGEGERTDGAALEQPAGRVERVDPVPEPEVARDEGAMTELVAMPVVMPAQLAVESVQPMVEMPE